MVKPRREERKIVGRKNKKAELLTLKQASQKTGLSVSMLRRAIKSGSLESQKVESRYGIQYMINTENLWRYVRVEKGAKNDTVRVIEGVNVKVQKKLPVLEQKVIELYEQRIEELKNRVAYLEKQNEWFMERYLLSLPPPRKKHLFSFRKKEDKSD